MNKIDLIIDALESAHHTNDTGVMGLTKLRLDTALAAARELNALKPEQDEWRKGFNAGYETANEQAEFKEIKRIEALEPIAWITDNYEQDRSATTFNIEVAKRWKEKGWRVAPLYALDEENT